MLAHLQSWRNSQVGLLSQGAPELDAPCIHGPQDGTQNLDRSAQVPNCTTVMFFFGDCACPLSTWHDRWSLTMVTVKLIPLKSAFFFSYIITLGCEPHTKIPLNLNLYLLFFFLPPLGANGPQSLQARVHSICTFKKFPSGVLMVAFQLTLNFLLGSMSPVQVQALLSLQAWWLLKVQECDLGLPILWWL